MADGFKPIPRCREGEISLLSADYANQLIDLLNSVGGGRVAPFAGVGSFKLAGGFYILDLSPLDTRLRSVEKGPVIPNGGAENYVLTKLSSADYDVGWRPSSSSNNGGGSCCDSLQDQINTLQGALDAVNARLDAASISASCADGEVTVTLDI